LFRKDIEQLTSLPVIGELSSFARSNNIFILHEKDNQLIKEEFRQLRTAIGLQNKNSNRKKLLFTSGIAEEGKSFVSTNMALSLALAGKKVILLDLDQSNPEITAILDLVNELGVTDYLQGEREPYEIIKSTFCENLFVCGYGRQLLSLTDFSINKKLEELFEYLEEAFDFIIIDSSPVESFSDAYLLSEYCDITNYIVRHNSTPKVLITLLEETNKIKPLKNVRIIFNGVKSRGMLKEKYGIGYGYGYEKFPIKQIKSKKRAGLLA
jgi:capsular exopolysaccharide synthesis family protein